MPRLSLQEVEYIAQLARLGLSDEEKDLLCEQLSAILEYAATINQLNTEGVEPMTSALPLRNVMRPDVTLPELTPDEALRNAPAVENGHFRVQSILE
ncbi:MAG: Asp-tRNA(Asn)/Glu-tRNA(Gln) amidotransferase subunit GatC [Anaerolineae bacterium]|nr:Asp-tRNA(Asn)/Glu-tRNA(Gln) amidotransferase subunit GatC [Anaerolineae bacterium]MDW8072140.1 Asp-tRNA(Asn)/Glu-tRNA(Gln) amidotransferase subunit GatC [Anaerolineae bacterium]